MGEGFVMCRERGQECGAFTVFESGGMLLEIREEVRKCLQLQQQHVRKLAKTDS